MNLDLTSGELQVLILDILSHLRTWALICPVTFVECEFNLQNLRTCGDIFKIQNPRSLVMSSVSSSDQLSTDNDVEKNDYPPILLSAQRCTSTSDINCQLTTQDNTNNEQRSWGDRSTSSLYNDSDSERELNYNNNNVNTMFEIPSDGANISTMFEELFDGETGEQVLLKHGDHNDYAYRNNTSISNTTSDAYITTITSIKDDGDKIIFDGTSTRRERRMLISISIYDDTSTSGSIVPCTSSSLYLRKDEDIGIISTRGIIHRLSNTNTDSMVSTNNDDNSNSTANTNHNDARSGLSSEHGERSMISTDSKYTSSSITIHDRNTQH